MKWFSRFLFTIVASGCANFLIRYYYWDKKYRERELERTLAEMKKRNGVVKLCSECNGSPHWVVVETKTQRRCHHPSTNDRGQCTYCGHWIALGSGR